MIKLKIIILILIFNQKIISSDWKPDFLILGAMKCGTTSLYHYLIQHPQIQPGNYKQIHFFDINYYKGLSWYKDRFPEKEKNKIYGEATPFYLFHPYAPKRVHDNFPDIKLIVLLCNPVKRVLSHFFFLKNIIARPNMDETLEDGLKKENERVWQNLKKMFQRKKYNIKQIRDFSYLSRGLYLNQIKRWLKYFPKNQIMFIISEEFYKDPKKTMNDVHKFLGVSEFELQNYKIYNKNTKKEKIKKETIDWLYKFYDKPNKDLEKFLQIKIPWWKHEN